MNPQTEGMVFTYEEFTQALSAFGGVLGQTIPELCDPAPAGLTPHESREILSASLSGLSSEIEKAGAAVILQAVDSMLDLKVHDSKPRFHLQALAF